MKNKVYTFQFYFVDPETSAYDETEFCSETESEAVKLFKQFCMDEFGIILPASMAVVYNEEDALEYGDRYGTPDELMKRGDEK